MSFRPGRTSGGAAKRPAFFRGEEGRARAEQEAVKDKAKQAARREAQNAPFRFRVKPGESTQFVILDDAPDFFRFEHNLKNPHTGFWDTFTGCVAEWDNCPVCEAAGKDAYYAMYLSVLDFTAFETKDGTVHEFSRKLLVVKPAQQKKFHRLYSRFVEDGLTLRGALIDVTRDTDKDSSIGNELDYAEHLSEDELAEYVREWTDKDKKRHTEDCSVPYDYEKLFEAPDVESLRAIVGGRPTPGSRAYEREQLPAESGRRRGAPRGAPEADDGQGDDWQKPETRRRMRPGAEEQEAPPVRSRPGSGRARPAPGAEDGDAQDAQPARTARPRPGVSRPASREPEPRPATRGGRRAATPIDDDDVPY